MAAGLLKGKVSIVTGASRGIGKGIAVQLAAQGSKVYITGRTLELSDCAKPVGSLKETKREIISRGGLCVAIQCDHSKDPETERLFERVKEENNGQLDILVNNAFSGNSTMLKERVNPFWEQSVGMWDEINNIGLRNNYMCSIYAARTMVQRKTGLIINVSSRGGATYMFNPAYGIGKAGVDRMAADCALELKKHNVAFVSLWPGPVCSESVMTWLLEAEARGEYVKEFKSVFETAETPEFVGKCVSALAIDPSIIEKTGKVLETLKLGAEYRVSDQDGHSPVSDGADVVLKFKNENTQ